MKGITLSILNGSDDDWHERCQSESLAREVIGRVHNFRLKFLCTNGFSERSELPLKRENPRFPEGFRWWAQLGLNQRPLRCQRSALPLSYAPDRPTVSATGTGFIAEFRVWQASLAERMRDA